jgi:ferrochelatase
VTAGRGIPEDRIAAVAEHYFAAGGGSPVNARCRELMASLQHELADLDLRLYWGNRNWHPFLEDTVAEMRYDRVERALAFVTSAYGGYSSCRQYLDDIAAARAKVGAGAPEIDKLRLYYNHPGWVGPWATSLLTALEACRAAFPGAPPSPESPVEVLFSAHSIPLSLARTSPYAEHVNEAARLVAHMAGTSSWQLVWQSRSGSRVSPWLGPDVCDVIEASRAPAVVVVPIGFACENMEVVHDLDVEAAAVAKKSGAHFERAATVSSSPAFVRMVGQLVQERLGLSHGPLALGALGPWPDTCPAGHCPAGRPAREASQTSPDCTTGHTA